MTKCPRCNGATFANHDEVLCVLCGTISEPIRAHERIPVSDAQPGRERNRKPSFPSPRWTAQEAEEWAAAGMRIPETALFVGQTRPVRPQPLPKRRQAPKAAPITSLECDECGTPFRPSKDQLARRARLGSTVYCGRSCQSRGMARKRWAHPRVGLRSEVL